MGRRQPVTAGVRMEVDRGGQAGTVGRTSCVQHWGALGDVTALTLGQLKFSGAWEEGGLGSATLKLGCVLE